jgi:prolyl-tRNA synthetase
MDPVGRWRSACRAIAISTCDLVVGRDFEPDGVIDAAEVRTGDPCPECDTGLELRRGIEIGHIFQLGRKYAEALGLEVLGPDGRNVVVTMGSYGIGVSRGVAAIAESTIDDLGLCWPREVAPADVHLVAVGTSQAIPQFADRLVSALASADVQVLYDDRTEVSAGVKLKDAELIGIPTIVIVGKGLADGTVEVRDRRSGATEPVPAGEIARYLIDRCHRSTTPAR